MDKYWDIFFNEVLPEILGDIPQEKIKELREAFSCHKDMEFEACGYIEAERSVDRIHRQEEADRVVRVVEDLCREMDGSGRFLDYAKQHQIIALAKIFNLRKHLRKEHKISV